MLDYDDFYKHIKFNGDVISNDSKYIEEFIQVLKKIFEKIILNQVYFDRDYYEEKYCPIEDELSKINFNIIALPVNNAWYDMENNTINISVYMLEMFIKLYSFEETEIKVNEKDIISLDALETLLNDPELRMMRRKAFKKYWKKNSKIIVDERKTIHLQWRIEYILNHFDDRRMIQGLEIVFRHEMAHWHIKRIKKNVREKEMCEIEEKLIYVIREQGFYQSYDYLSTHPETIVLWCEEIYADLIAIDMSHHICDGQLSEQKDMFIAIAMYYTLLRAEEVKNIKTITIQKTHPPTLLRERTVFFLLAETNKSSVLEYAIYTAGAWMAIRSVFETIFDDIIIETNENFKNNR